MAVAILMPALSPTMTEGNLAKWCKNVGDEIKSGDIIAEVEQSMEWTFPQLKTGELIMVTSLEHRNLITELLVQQGFRKNKHWVLFS